MTRDVIRKIKHTFVARVIQRSEGYFLPNKLTINNTNKYSPIGVIETRAIKLNVRQYTLSISGGNSYISGINDDSPNRSNKANR